MILNEHEILKLIKQGESLTLEFKECRRALSRDVYETVCAFLNRHGGTLLLGVSDSGAVTGVAPEAVAQMKKDFVTAINNPQKISPPCYMSVDEVQVKGGPVLYVYVPESSQVHRCNNRIFDRNEDGDLDITDHTVQVAHLYQRKQATYSENRVYPQIQPGDLCGDLIERCRKYVRINKPQHPWGTMDNLDLIKSAQLYQPHPETGEMGITLAGVMLLAPDDLILKVCPSHRTDLILRKVNVDRYDDRDLVITNLIDSYDRILAFVQKHLPDPFYLEGIERRSLRDNIFREVASNMLIHREYASGATSRLVIEYGRVVTDNPSRPHGFGRLDPVANVPYQKNPVIGRFFRQIDRADELGSGMRKMMLYGKKYGGSDPELFEGDNFRMIISVPEFGENPASVTQVRKKMGTGAESKPEVTPQDAPPVGTKSGLSRDQVLIIPNLLHEKKISELLIIVGRSNRTKFRDQVLRPLIDSGLVEMTIPDKPNSRLQKYRLTEKGKLLLNTQSAVNTGERKRK